MLCPKKIVLSGAHLGRVIILLTALVLPSAELSAASDHHLTEWYRNYATIAQGATISSPAKLHRGFELEGIIGGKDFPQGRDSIGVVFADGIEQREEFTIDLGQTRNLGLIVFECDLPKRTPASLKIEISNESAQGPWKTVLQTDTVYLRHDIGLNDEVPARFIHVDLGINRSGRGSRVRSLRVFPRYHLKPAEELIRELAGVLRRDLPELAAFWKAFDAGRLSNACDELTYYYAARGERIREDFRKENPGYRVPEQIQKIMRNEVEDGGYTYKFESSDWNWHAHKPGNPIPSLGWLPGAYSIFHGLTNAWLGTEDEAYAKKTAELLTDWLMDNPYPGWHSDENGDLIDAWAGLKCSGRSGVFSRMSLLFCTKESPFSRDLKINLIYSVWQHLVQLDRIRVALGGNWLTNVNSGLFSTALEHPEFTDQKKWLQDSLESFEQSLSRDVYPCGREVEDSTMYVPIASGQMLRQYKKIRELGLKLTPESERKMSLLWDAIAWMTFPNGAGQAIGDCARLSPLKSGGEFAPQLFLELFDRPDLVYMNTRGKSGSVPKETSRAFAGWYVMRTAWEEKPFEDARYLFFKCTQNRTHSHRDQLEITLYAYGRELLTDPGMTPYGLPTGRIASSTPMHNTICVNESDQAETPGKENAWAAGKGADFADAEFHYGTVIGRRQILFLKSGNGLPDYWYVRDHVHGRTTEHVLDINFHFPEDAQLVAGSRSVRTDYKEGGNLFILSNCRPTIEESWIADRLRGNVPAKCARYRMRAMPPTGFETFLLPYRGPNVPGFKTEALVPDGSTMDQEAKAFIVTTGNGKDIVMTCLEAGKKLSFDKGRLQTDGQAVILRFDRSSRLVYAFQYGGTSCYLEGERVLAVPTGQAFVELMK